MNLVYVSQLLPSGVESTAQVVVPAGTHTMLIDDEMTQVAHITLVVERDAQATYQAVLTVRDCTMQRTVVAHCDGPGSRVSIEISCHTQGTGQFILVTQQNHTSSHSTSSSRILGVSSDTSRASIASTISIAKNLMGVAATQVHKHLLLDSGSRVVSIPGLDILSNDVSCSHGSAIAHLDAAQLFYLNARGYNEQEARDAMVKAFLVA